MIDLHTHTFLSDGELIPSEHVYRAQIKGIEIIGLTDHVDSSNIDFVVPRLVKVAEELNKCLNIKVIPGCELTHAPPAMIKDMAKEARLLGARIVIVHGETIAETVPPGTNLAGLEADIDILAHPGLITEEEVLLAKNNGVLLEITTRSIHAFTNGHIASLAKKIGADLILNTDSHSSIDFIDKNFAEKIALGCGLSFDELLSNARKLAKKYLR